MQLKQHGGEGKESYKGQKNDKSLRQLGGEQLKGSGGKNLLKSGGAYGGPGRNL